MKPSKQVCADIEIKRLGMEFESTPPESVVVKMIKPGLWAQAAGIQPGDEIVQINQVCVCDMTFNEFMLELQKRPMNMGIAVPKSQDHGMDSEESDLMHHTKTYRPVKKPKQLKNDKAKEYKNSAEASLKIPQQQSSKAGKNKDSRARISKGSDAPAARPQLGRGNNGLSAPAAPQQGVGGKAKKPMPAG